MAQDLDISSIQVLVLLLAAHHENSENGRCFAANETIALEGKMNEKTVRRAFSVLKQKKLISTIPFGRTNLITFHLPPRPKVKELEVEDVGTQSPPTGPQSPPTGPQNPNIESLVGTQSPHVGTQSPLTGPQSPANKVLTKNESGMESGRSDQIRSAQLIQIPFLSSGSNDEESGAEKEKGEEEGTGTTLAIASSVPLGAVKEKVVIAPVHPLAVKFLSLVGSTPKLERKGPAWDSIAGQLQEQYPAVDLMQVLDWVWSHPDPFWRKQFVERRSDPFEHFGNSKTMVNILDQYLRQTKSTIKKEMKNEATTRPILTHFK